MEYRTDTAFRTALEERLRQRAEREGEPIARLRKRVVFERCMVRLQQDPNSLWVLKGGFALELRLGNLARMTKDLDLTANVGFLGADSKSLSSLSEKLREDLKRENEDRFVFLVAEGSEEELPTQGVQSFRFSVEARLEWALLDAIAMRNEEAEKRITEAYLATVEGQIPANQARWSALRERLLITFGQRGKLRTLEKLAADHSENSDVQRYLGLAYSDYEEYMKAGQSFILAAKKAEDKKTEMARYADAAIAFTRASQKEPAEDAFKRMKALALHIDDGEVVLIKTLRELADIKHDRDLFFGSAERHLELYPDDTDTFLARLQLFASSRKRTVPLSLLEDSVPAAHGGHLE